MRFEFHRVWFVLAALALCTTQAWARVALVVGEPFGPFGTMMPVGHAGIYLDRVCAATATRLRPCEDGELGVVISRYHDLKKQKLDWLAFPAFRFFYGVDDARDVPRFVTKKMEAELRERYRQRYLAEILPARLGRDGREHPPAYGDWEEGIGAAFDRRLLVYSLESTPEQDARIMEMLNDRPNERRYNLGRHNCADFAAELLGVVMPGVLHRNVVGDFDMTTPKGLMRQLEAYGVAHPEADLRVYEVPQLPGTLRRSRPLRGSAETFVKTKRYVAALAVLQPELLLADWICYETKGKWTPKLAAKRLEPEDWRPLYRAEDYSPASTDSSTSSEASGFLAK